MEQHSQTVVPRHSSELAGHDIRLAHVHAADVWPGQRESAEIMAEAEARLAHAEVRLADSRRMLAEAIAERARFQAESVVEFKRESKLTELAVLNLARGDTEDDNEAKEDAKEYSHHSPFEIKSNY